MKEDYGKGSEKLHGKDGAIPLMNRIHSIPGTVPRGPCSEDVPNSFSPPARQEHILKSVPDGLGTG